VGGRLALIPIVHEGAPGGGDRQRRAHAVVAKVLDSQHIGEVVQQEGNPP